MAKTKQVRAPLSEGTSVWPHRLAVALACLTFPLLFLGGLVTSMGAGLAVPDWPTTFGYNMFLYPWSEMIGNIFYEHSHRLVASMVGLVTIVLAVTFVRCEPRRWLRWLAVGALGLVIFQGILGGLRVVLLEHVLAIVHACFAQAFFALTVSLAVFTSPTWLRAPVSSVDDHGRLKRLAMITVAMIYLQIVFGAILRHTGLRLDAHLLFAALVTVHVILLVLRIMKIHGGNALLERPALLLAGLLAVQLILGTLSYLAKYTTMLRTGSDILVLLTTTHLIVGSLMLAAVLVLALRSHRCSRRESSAVGQRALKEQFSV